MTQRPIVYATNYSNASQHALQIAAVLADQCHAKLVIIHVSNHEQYPVGELFDEEPQDDEEELSKLRRVVPNVPGILFEHRLVYAAPTSANVHPGDEIVKLASELNATAIVIGMRGRSALSRMLAAGIADSVIQKAPCLVVAVKSPSKG